MCRVTKVFIQQHIQGAKHGFHHWAFVILIKCHKTSLQTGTETGCDAQMFTSGKGRRLMHQKNTNQLPSQPVVCGLFFFFFIYQIETPVNTSQTRHIYYSLGKLVNIMWLAVIWLQNTEQETSYSANLNVVLKCLHHGCCYVGFWELDVPIFGQEERQVISKRSQPAFINL